MKKILLIAGGAMVLLLVGAGVFVGRPAGGGGIPPAAVAATGPRAGRHSAAVPPPVSTSTGAAVRAAALTASPGTAAPPAAPAVPARTTEDRNLRKAGHAGDPHESAGRSAAAVAFPAGRWNLADPKVRQQVVTELADRSRKEKEAALAQARREGWSPEGDGYELMAIRDGRVWMNKTENANAAISTAANQIRQTAPYNLSGAGLTVGVWDQGGVRTTHQELSGRVTLRDSISPADHATHVGGTIGATGLVASAKGMAPCVRLDSYDWGSDDAEMASRAMSYSGETNTIQISNHSYGHITGWDRNYVDYPHGIRWYGVWGDREDRAFGIYNFDAAIWDQICYSAPFYLPFKAAANERDDTAPASGSTFEYYNGTNWVATTYSPSTGPYSDNWDSGGFDTIPDVSCAKNVMTVGAVSDAVLDGVRSTAQAAMASFSSWGPADDGRIKPDIVANGVGVYSTMSSLGDEYYGTMDGTSMATPNAAGSAILLAEYHRKLFGGRCIRAATLKSLIIHTADDLGNPGPDYSYGWGLMNVKAAADLLKAHSEMPAARRLVEASLSATNLTNSLSVLCIPGSPVRATLCWVDPPGEPVSGLDDPSPRLVNDLNLRVIDPAGHTNFPYVMDRLNPTAAATNGNNTVDNVEQVCIASASGTGTWTVLVESAAGLFNGVQDYSLLISGSTVAPTIEHTPVENTTNTVGSYDVDALITPREMVATNQARVFWNLDGNPSLFFTNVMSGVTGDLYRAEIPAQPLGTTVYYYLYAETTNGHGAVSPVAAPGELYSFSVVEPLAFVVAGSPVETGGVSPPYGSNYFASGVVVRASAPSSSELEASARFSCDGWRGAGSVPAEGTSNSVSVRLDSPSSIEWQWSVQYGLAQTSSVSGLLSTTTWWAIGATADTVTAASPVSFNGTNYYFAQWAIDEARQPDGTSAAVNPVRGIVMSAPHVAIASYLPEDEDADGDNMADWWELFHFGSTNTASDFDADGDGFPNLDEYRDGTDPRNIGSVPSPPGIAHTPLSNPQGQPAPYMVQATVTDNFRVAEATLWWSRNGAGWQSAPMATNGAGGVYTNAIPAPGTNGDHFAYCLAAQDPLGLATTTSVCEFDVVYPRLDVSPMDLGTNLLLWGAASNADVLLSNGGNTDLVWTLAVLRDGLSLDAASATNGWTHSGTNDQWRISTNRWSSRPAAWYNGNNAASPTYADSADASLLSEPIRLAANSWLTFRHWISSELYTGHSSYAWDGGIVELSTNAGVSYVQITPVGGYPCKIQNNTGCPFSQNTPCYAGTGGWQSASFDLSSFADEIVRLRFRFGCDDNTHYEGWYIDDIAVAPFSGTSQWVVVSATNGVVPAGTETNVAVSIVTTNGLSGRDLLAHLRFTGNGSVPSVRLVPVCLRVRSKPVLELSFAAQSSTNGEGDVTVSNRLSDLDGEKCDVEVLFSTDWGNSWTGAWLRSVQGTAGAPLISNSQPRQVVGAATTNGAGLATNVLTLVWSTTNGPAPVVVSTATVFRVRAWDGLFWSEPVTSAAFMVDNEAPLAPTGLASSTHSPGVWSTNRSIRMAWGDAGDGLGTGVKRYGVMFTNTAAPAGKPLLSTTNLDMPGPALGDGTNWWSGVCAIDGCGNASTSVFAGPYRIDATAPSSAGATVSVSHSAFGSYVVGTPLDGSWAGFSDSLSGIAGYYFSLTNNQGTTNGLWTTATTGVLAAAVDQTNRFYVWAGDNAGAVGSAASATILVLDPEKDWDNDGLSNQAEEISGTDAANGRSLFELSGISALASGPSAILAWHSVTGRFYSLYSAAQLDGAPAPWVPVPACQRQPGTGDIMTYEDTFSVDTQRFYKLTVEVGGE